MLICWVVGRDHFDQLVEASLRRGMWFGFFSFFIQSPVKNTAHPFLPLSFSLFLYLLLIAPPPPPPPLLTFPTNKPPDLPIITTPHAKSHLASASKAPGEAFTAIYDLDHFDECMVGIKGSGAAIRVTGMPGKHVPPGPGGVAGKVNDLIGAVSGVLFLLLCFALFCFYLSPFFSPLLPSPHILSPTASSAQPRSPP